MNGQLLAQSGQQKIETSSFAASAAYGEEEISRLLQDSGSILSLTLGEAADDSLGAIWAPDPASNVPLRRTISKLMPGNPRTDDRGQYLHADKVVALSTPGPQGSSDVLSAISSLASRSFALNRAKKSRNLRFFADYLMRMREVSMVSLLKTIRLR